MASQLATATDLSQRADDAGSLAEIITISCLRKAWMKTLTERAPQVCIVSMKNWQKQLPMAITTSRILMVPFILALMAMDTSVARITGAVLFIVASFSDWADGHYARKFNAVSTMGKFMDPIADKILVTGVLVALIPSGRIDPWMVIIVLSRDTLVGGLRSVAAADQIIIAAKSAGKWKTALQMIAIPLLMLGEDLGGLPTLKVGFWTLWFTVLLSVISGADYLKAYLRAKNRTQQASR